MSGQTENLWALVPVKALGEAKHRLKICLGEDREGFTVAMLGDVLAALSESKEIQHIAVVTDDPRVAAITRQGGLNLVTDDESKGMNNALEMGRDAIRRMGGQRMVIVPADIPLLTGPETDRVVLEVQDQRQAQGDHITGIVPSKDRGGTNFLCIDTQPSFSLMYGPGSYVRHSEYALEHGCRCVTLDSPPISLDIDEKKDLDEFISLCFSNPENQLTESWRFLQDNGYVNPLHREGKVYGN
jgi:2-phospho-L-lactate guanylyltransferase